MPALDTTPHCPHSSPLRRREFLRLGLAGFSGLSLPALLRLRAASAPTPNRNRTALIVVWLQGGASHIETYDPKPEAPNEYRGPYQPIATKNPGLRICELLPHHARIADKFTILRSLVHTGNCHDDGPQQLFTGYPFQGRRLKPLNPDLLSITHYLRTDPARKIPNYIGLNPIPYLGTAYLGPKYEPFAVNVDPNQPGFQVPNVGLKDKKQLGSLNRRIGLRKSFDRLRRDIDQTGNMDALDAFEKQAWNQLSSPATARAFDLKQEPDSIRDRYGRNVWGQRCLLARRLVEAGVDIVTTSLNGSLCGRVGNWDDHAVNHHVFDAMKSRAPYFDQAVAALIEDVYERGLDQRVMVVVAGDFGRTPRISYANDSGSGIRQPGRDHWPSAMSFLFSGGNISTGEVIGTTDALGQFVSNRRLGIGDFVATLYHHLGVDTRLSIPDHSGRPIPILPTGKPIPELVAVGA